MSPTRSSSLARTKPYIYPGKLNREEHADFDLLCPLRRLALEKKEVCVPLCIFCVLRPWFLCSPSTLEWENSTINH
jgi:hypothetical protein